MSSQGPVPPVSALTVDDLCPRLACEAPRQFRARLVNVEPRVTHRGVPWAVLSFAWSGRTLRCPCFPGQWLHSPELVLGDVYGVVGRVSHRDRVPVVQVLELERSLVLCRGLPGVPGDDVEEPQG